MSGSLEDREKLCRETRPVGAAGVFSQLFSLIDFHECCHNFMKTHERKFSISFQYKNKNCTELR